MFMRGKEPLNMIIEREENMDNISITNINGDPVNYLYQWDANQKVIITGLNVAGEVNVHFCNIDSEFALITRAEVTADSISAEVPNILLQKPKPVVLYVYNTNASTGERTVYMSRITIIPRPRPADYIYTETETLHYSALDERIRALENALENSAGKTSSGFHVGPEPPEDPNAGLWLDTDEESGGNSEQIEPMEDDIPKVFFGGALQQTKDDAVMSFRYVSKTADINCYCKTKAQGNSSMSYPKKNQTVKLYKDAECTKKLKVNFKGWGEQNKFCFKANWVDITHARNVVSARLWGDVVKSRSNYAELPELLRTSPNQGAIDGFPVKVYADGVYQGRYTLNIPKDAWMANMDDELDNHCILCGENAENGSSQFKAEALIDGTDWSDEIHDTVPESIKTRWNEVIRFVMNSTDEEFVENLGNYFDVPSLIDYYLFGIASCNYDGFKKNQLYYTYDGVKWYAGAYDMDLTWGNALDGTELAEHDRKWYMEYDWNRLYCRLDALFINELRERWNELKDSTLSVANVINHFERFADICPPWLVAEDYAETTANGAFTAMPTISTIQQIRDYAKKRHAWTNAYLGGHDFGCLMVYELNNTELNGTYGIDTGVNLNAMNAYTVLIDYTMHNIETQSCILDNSNNSSGWAMQYSPTVKFGAFGAGTTGVIEAIHPWATQDPTGIRTKVMVRKTADGQYTFRSSDMESAHFANFTEKFGENDPGQNLWIGGNFYGIGVVNAFANATIHDCKVYDIALTDTAVLEYLQS